MLELRPWAASGTPEVPLSLIPPLTPLCVSHRRMGSTCHEERQAGPSALGLLPGQVSGRRRGVGPRPCSAGCTFKRPCQPGCSPGMQNWVHTFSFISSASIFVWPPSSPLRLGRGAPIGASCTASLTGQRADQLPCAIMPGPLWGAACEPLQRLGQACQGDLRGMGWGDSASSPPTLCVPSPTATTPGSPRVKSKLLSRTRQPRRSPGR